MRLNIIDCNQHDYIEIACLYGYQVRLALKNGTIVEGKAIDVSTADKCEYWIIDSGERQQVALSQIVKIDVLTANAKFSALTL